MIKIIFKNVDQGDSIILEWQKDDLQKVAIIDCNLAFGGNPVLKHVIEKEYEKIDFLLLSHPHLDHYSGFVELIDYCILKNIKIDYFLFTGNNMPSFWKAAADGKLAETEILKLFHKIREAAKALGMKYQQIQGEAYWDEINLSDKLKIKVLAPTAGQLDSFALGYIDPPFEEASGNNPKANLLSTFLKIYSDKWYVLLASDTERAVTKYYGIQHYDQFDGNFILGQSPHHGAFKNHVNAFWKRIPSKSKRRIVFSVGNNHYSHPSREAVNFFLKEGYEIFSTNQVGGLSGETISESARLAISHLDIFSRTIPISKKDKFNGDKIFEIDLEGNITTG